MAIVTLAAKVHFKNKNDCLAQYKDHVNDEWTGLLRRRAGLPKIRFHDLSGHRPVGHEKVIIPGAELFLPLAAVGGTITGVANSVQPIG